MILIHHNIAKTLLNSKNNIIHDAKAKCCVTIQSFIYSCYRFLSYIAGTGFPEVLAFDLPHMKKHKICNKDQSLQTKKNLQR